MFLNEVFFTKPAFIWAADLLLKKRIIINVEISCDASYFYYVKTMFI